MTQDQLDYANACAARIEAAGQRYERELAFIENELAALGEVCDHLRPDGTSAVVRPRPFTVRRCDYCGALPQQIRARAEREQDETDQDCLGKEASARP